MQSPCGAWVGGWSRALAKEFATVIAIEAHPANARCIAKNVADSDRVVVRNVALGESSGTVCIGKEKFGPNVGSRVCERSEIRVPLRRLDSLPAVRSLKHVDYMKVHVNGMELKALRGAVETIERCRPVMTVVLKPAIEDFGDTADAARAFLKELGYVPAGGERPYEIWSPK